MSLVSSVAPFRITKNLNQFRVIGTIVPSGSYATGGDVLDFTATAYPIGQGPMPSTKPPIAVEIYSQKTVASPQTNEFAYAFAPGTTQANGKMQVFTGAAAQTALTELNAGAYPAGVLADVIIFEAVFEAV